MYVSEGKYGRVFVLRLEDGDSLPDCVERFAQDHGVERALCAMIGGIGGGHVVAGPEDPLTSPIVPILHAIESVHEAAAVGTIFPGEDGTPKLHMHAALGRDGETRTGCVRPGVDVWKIGEVIVLEIVGTAMRRRVDPETGFEMLGER